MEHNMGDENEWDAEDCIGWLRYHPNVVVSHTAWCSAAPPGHYPLTVSTTGFTNDYGVCGGKISNDDARKAVRDLATHLGVPLPWEDDWFEECYLMNHERRRQIAWQWDSDIYVGEIEVELHGGWFSAYRLPGTREFIILSDRTVRMRAQASKNAMYWLANALGKYGSYGSLGSGISRIWARPGPIPADYHCHVGYWTLPVAQMGEWDMHTFAGCEHLRPFIDVGRSSDDYVNPSMLRTLASCAARYSEASDRIWWGSEMPAPDWWANKEDHR